MWIQTAVILLDELNRRSHTQQIVKQHLKYILLFNYSRLPNHQILDLNPKEAKLLITLLLCHLFVQLITALNIHQQLFILLSIARVWSLIIIDFNLCLFLIIFIVGFWSWAIINLNLFTITLVIRLRESVALILLVYYNLFVLSLVLLYFILAHLTFFLQQIKLFISLLELEFRIQWFFKSLFSDCFEIYVKQTSKLSFLIPFASLKPTVDQLYQKIQVNLQLYVV